jgi:hypothetical protein
MWLIMTHITIRVMTMTHITNRLIMRVLPMDKTHIMILLLPMAMKKHMTHITNRHTMTHITNRLTMTHITNRVITDVIETVTYTQCCKSHVGSKQHINIMHKNICTKTL